MNSGETVKLMSLFASDEANYDIGRFLLKTHNKECIETKRKKDCLNSKKFLKALGLISIRKTYIGEDSWRKNRGTKYTLRFKGDQKIIIRKTTRVIGSISKITTTKGLKFHVDNHIVNQNFTMHYYHGTNLPRGKRYKLDSNKLNIIWDFILRFIKKIED